MDRQIVLFSREARMNVTTLTELMPCAGNSSEKRDAGLASRIRFANVD